MDSVSVPPRGYMEGTLGISFVDRKTGSLLWHGYTTQGIPIAQETDAELKKAVPSATCEGKGSTGQGTGVPRGACSTGKGKGASQWPMVAVADGRGGVVRPAPRGCGRRRRRG